MSGCVDARVGLRLGHRFPLACAVLRPLVTILFPLPSRRRGTMMARHTTGQSILHSNLHLEVHDWKQLFDGQEPTWEQVNLLLKETIREGQESVHEDRLSQFERAIEYNGHRVFVRFVKGTDDLAEHISTGYFKGE